MTQSPPPVGDQLNAGAARPLIDLPRHAYTSWLKRVGAVLIDVAPVCVLLAVGIIVFISTRVCVDYPITGLGTDEKPFLQHSCGATPVGQWALAVFPVAAIAFQVWNYGYKQGVTGSSIGKGIMKFKVVSEVTCQPIGFGRSVVRQILHVLIDGLLFNVGYLFPLVDNKRQTFADKIVKTVCVPV